MISEPRVAYVWIWLHDAVEPVVAGRLDAVGPTVTFTYGRSYLERVDRIPLYLPELPFGDDAIAPRTGNIASCIADAGPDAWGMRVIANRLLSRSTADLDEISSLAYLLESGSDRIGALDFQSSPTTYVARSTVHATLDDLAEAADRVDRGLPLSQELDLALLHASSIGGARPKALVRVGAQLCLAKFSSASDTLAVVKGEYLSMELARRAGLDVAPVKLAEALGKDVLLVERFDRTGDGRRRAMVSTLTILELDEMMARYASYADLADIIRARFTDARATLRELFARISFNILVSNTDDHPRNHAAFWDGQTLKLTPAFDICPQLRSGGEAAQLMAIGRDGWRSSQLAGFVERASVYLLSESEARGIIDHQIDVIKSQWNEVARMARLTKIEELGFWRHQFLNPYALDGY